MHDAVSGPIWATRYRCRTDRTLKDTWRRVAKAVEREAD
jgi:hypothetical protein